jgi:phenylalanyl-tRNA synthetase beta chain
MDISYKWLSELVEGLPAPRELAERLTMAGLAVDAVKEGGDDHVLEFDLTSNRPDCLSHLGVAREAAALAGARVTPPESTAKSVEGRAEEFTSVVIEDEDLCPRYAARVVRGVKIAPSPEWLVKRLQSIGQRPINNVADITNFVMHEMGQPLHAFDLATLDGRRIVVRRARAGEKLKTLDGVDYEGVRRAQDRCVALICELAGGVATVDAVDVYPKRVAPRTVSLRPRRVEELTGLSVEADESVRILTSLGFEKTGGEGEEGRVSFVAPTWRTDVSIEEDLVEEVARVYGYDKIGEALPPSPVTGEYLAGDRRRRAMRQALTASGFDEAINISFIDEAGATDDSGGGRFETVPGLMRGEGDSEAEGEGAFVKLSNPIVEGARLMRPTLLPGLLESLRNNFNHGTRNVRLFETGRVFAARGDKDEDERPNEVEAFALVVTGQALEEGRATGRESDFYDLKGALESAADAMRVIGLGFEAASVRHLREGQSARVTLRGEDVGTLGRLSEEVATHYKFRQPVYVAEVSLTALLTSVEEPSRYAPLPRFPSVVRDVSLLADRRAGFGEMRRAVLSLGLEECRGVSLVDVYEGASVPEGKRSVTLRVEYRADDRTLRDEDADQMHARAVAALEREFGATLRG